MTRLVLWVLMVKHASFDAPYVGVALYKYEYNDFVMRSGSLRNHFTWISRLAKYVRLCIMPDRATRTAAMMTCGAG